MVKEDKQKTEAKQEEEKTEKKKKVKKIGETESEEKKKEKKKEKIEEEIKKKAEKKYLVDLSLYLATKIYVGHKIIMPDMRQYVFKRKADGVAVFNMDLIDLKLREAIDYISKFNEKDIIVVGKKPVCWNAIEKFSYFTGIKAFKKYPPGILTNPQLSNFIEPKLVIIVDPIADKNALHDANIARIPVLALCNTNHHTKGIDFVLPVNNKDEQALNLVFYILASGYLKSRGIDKTIKVSDFVEINEENK